eukprot:TRINITY_DN931_c0_g1_i6.p5 TRINITY_DN931_c0_g1~~TRINITY_DN931_c0_g1_i6.p5  ORF type:complete len:101 (-),score=4.34 TRINITY_DN931_c0_g1_i6:660-962(-)
MQQLAADDYKALKEEAKTEYISLIKQFSTFSFCLFMLRQLQFYVDQEFPCFATIVLLIPCMQGIMVSQKKKLLKTIYLLNCLGTQQGSYKNYVLCKIVNC